MFVRYPGSWAVIVALASSACSPPPQTSLPLAEQLQAQAEQPSPSREPQPENTEAESRPGEPGEGAVVTASFEGDAVEVSGTIRLPAAFEDSPIQVDLNGAADNGTHLSNTQVQGGGDFTTLAPLGVGAASIRVFVLDPELSIRDRPVFDWGPIQIGEQPIKDLEIDLTESEHSTIGALETAVPGPSAADEAL